MPTRTFKTINVAHLCASHLIPIGRSATPRVHLGGSSSGIGHVPPCICEASVTVDLAIGSGYFQVPVYTLLHIPEDTHRGGAVAVVSLGPLCL